MNDTPDGSVRGLLDAYLKSDDPNDDQSVGSTDSEVDSQDIADDVVSKYRQLIKQTDTVSNQINFINERIPEFSNTFGDNSPEEEVNGFVEFLNEQFADRDNSDKELLDHVEASMQELRHNLQQQFSAMGEINKHEEHKLMDAVDEHYQLSESFRNNIENNMSNNEMDNEMDINQMKSAVVVSAVMSKFSDDVDYLDHMNNFLNDMRDLKKEGIGQLNNYKDLMQFSNSENSEDFARKMGDFNDFYTHFPGRIEETYNTLESYVHQRDVRDKQYEESPVSIRSKP